MTRASSERHRARGLVDSFGRKVTYLRLSVTNRCNFRCVYCMPAEGIGLEPSSELLSFEEIFRVVSALALYGVRRVRITGGEPLVRRDLPLLIAMLHRIEGIDEVVMTSNGMLLPRFADKLAEAGLNELTVSVDTLREDRFSRITRGGSLAEVLEGLAAAKEAGFEKIKINTVLIRGFNDDEIIDLVQWSIDAGHTLRFIEFMPIGEGTVWGELQAGGCVPAAEIRAVISSRYVATPLGFVAGAGPSRYLALDGPSVPTTRASKVGIISAVTECFCESCNRIRMTPQGGIRACLADDHEQSLKELMRAGCSDADLRDAVGRALGAKKETHSFDLEGGNVTLKRMVSIGG